MLRENTADKAKFIPKSGYSVVGIDDFEMPGEQLYLIGHFGSEQAAQSALTKFRKDNPSEKAYVYGPETK
jgi:hypothetical protein